jgi:hypothetical protein
MVRRAAADFGRGAGGTVRGCDGQTSEGTRKCMEGLRAASAARRARTDESPVGVKTPCGVGGTNGHPQPVWCESSERREIPGEVARLAARRVRAVVPTLKPLEGRAVREMPTPSSGFKR